MKLVSDISPVPVILLAREAPHAQSREPRMGMRLVRVVAAAASAAIGIGIVLHLRKRLRQSALENSVGAAPKPGIKRAGVSGVGEKRRGKGLAAKGSLLRVASCRRRV